MTERVSWVDKENADQIDEEEEKTEDSGELRDKEDDQGIEIQENQ